MNYYKKLNSQITFKLAYFSIALIIIQLSYRIYCELPMLKAYSKFEISKREFAIQNKNLQTEVNFQNFNEFNTPNISEKIVTFLLREISPNSLKAWSKILKHEPILPNIIEKTEVKVYEECFSEAFDQKIKIAQ